MPSDEEVIVQGLTRLAEDLESMVAVLKRRGVCSECGRAWILEEERWRSYLTVDDETALYCPSCAEEEFGDA